MKWMLFLILLASCVNRKIKTNELIPCPEIVEVVKTKWDKIQSDTIGASYICKKGFFEDFSKALNSEQCIGTMDKTSLIGLLGAPNGNFDRAMGYFMMIEPTLDTSLYYTISYKCLSHRRVIWDGKIENARNNILFLVEKKSDLVRQIFRVGL
jgi:hypothetical protein